MRGVARACVPVRSGRYRWRFGCGCQCHPSSVVEQCFRKAQVVGSSPMGGFHYATGGALRAAPVASFQPPSASPVATRASAADWIGRRSWSSRLVPPRRWPRRQSRRVPWVAFTTQQTFTQASSLRDIGLRGRLGLGGCGGVVAGNGRRSSMLWHRGASGIGRNQ